MKVESEIGRKHPWMPEDVKNATVTLLSPPPVIYHRIPTVKHLPYCPICSSPTARNVTSIVRKLPSWEW